MGKLFYKGENKACDLVAFGRKDNQTCVVLIQRGDSGRVALPGGFIDKDESPDNAAVREFKEECGVDVKKGDILELAKRDDHWRDSRANEESFVSTQPYATILNENQIKQLKAGDDAVSVSLIPVNEALKKINFADHKEILREAIGKLKITQNEPPMVSNFISHQASLKRSFGEK